MSRFVAVVAASLALAGLLVTLLNGTVFLAWIVYLPYACVGALLAIRRPRNWIGWLLIAVGWGFLLGFLNALASTTALAAGTAPVFLSLISWISSWAWFAALALFVVIMVIFPASHLPIGRWRWPALATIAIAWLGVVLLSFTPTITINKPDGSGTFSLANPLARLVSQPPRSWLAGIAPLGVVLLMAALVVGTGSMVMRMRRAERLEHQQLRWLVAALVTVTLTVLLGVLGSAIFGDALPGIALLPPILAFLAVPLAIGVAVLRYRLYDIDTIINRAVLYGAVTIVILALFGVANLGLQRALETWTGGQSALLTGFIGLAVGSQYGRLHGRVRPVVDRFLPSRALLTMLFTDIVGSTEHLVALGDESWRMLLARYRAAVRQELSRFGGHEVDTAGDSFFATFERPRAGASCARAIHSAVANVGLQLRTGVHFGECEMRGEKVSGIEVHTAARIMAAAGPDEILLSDALRTAISDTDFVLADRGAHLLKGVPGQWTLYSLEGISSDAPLLSAVRDVAPDPPRITGPGRR